MVNQKLLPVVDVTAAPCCEPLAREPLPPAGAEELAPLFKALADPVRLRLLSLIACHDGGESCVCDLLGAFDMTAPSVSYHLKVLREAGLIHGEVLGPATCYCRDEVAIGWLKRAIQEL
ncbi:MAG TPA: metalloregulator ArsR/SmtB family transcription factor [Thermomicrobiaceae bacterium]|nr:metalloregulator ArsR/SmtB family transcription factor [Thermomicrobiaceae bacterium]